MTPARVRLARLPTPIEPLDRLSERWGGPRLWVKRDDLTGTILTGNKIRKLEFCLGEALAQGHDTVRTCGGVQSNHCRATAAACARLGLKCVVYLRTDDPPQVPDGNHLLDRLLGADVRFVTPEEYRALGPTDAGYWIPEGASNEVGLWGYASAWDEIDREFDAFWHAIGSGGTTAGLAMGGRATPLVAVCVCDDPAFFRDKVGAITDAALARWPALPEPAPVEIVDGFQGRGYALNRPEEFALLRDVAETEGLVLDPVYTVKAMLGLREAIRGGRYGPGENVLFLHTGGVYGLFPKRRDIWTSSGS